MYKVIFDVTDDGDDDDDDGVTFRGHISLLAAASAGRVSRFLS